MTEALLAKKAFRPARSRRAIWLWQEVVGTQLAQKSEPYRIEGSTLFVRVPSPAWAEELFLMKTTVLKALAARLGKGVVTELRFEVARAQRPERRARKGDAPVTHPELHQPLAEDDGWPDGPLGDALRSVYQHAAERGSPLRSSTSEATSSSISKTSS